MKKCSSMAEVRTEIDRVDQLMVPLLLERLNYIEQAGELKADRATVRDDWRVEDVIAKVISAAKSAGGNVKMIEDIYRHLIEWSIAHEFDVFDAQESHEDQDSAA